MKNFRLGKYGRLRLNYLKTNKKAEYTILQMENKLQKHLTDVDITATNRVNAIIKELAKKENVNEENHFRTVFQPKNVILIILLGLCLQLGVSFLLNLVAYLKPEWFESYQELMEQLVMDNSIISVVYIGLIAPISEELIFRGVILHKSKKVMSLTAANIFQAVLFGIYHMNMVQGVYAFLIGIFFGFICIKLKSLYGAILLHMAINIGGILLGLIPEETDMSNILIVATLILSAAGTILITNYFRKIEDENTSSISDY